MNFENQYSQDDDGDGFTEYDGDCNDGNFNIGPEECRDDDGDGQREIDGDCDDTDPKVYLGNLENESELGCYIDNDGDGYGDANLADNDLVGVTTGSDCDDSNGAIYPGPDKEEICDENLVDENCNGRINNEDAQLLSEVSTTTYYKDGDGDGFGTESVTIQYCEFQVSNENNAESEETSIEGYVANPIFDCDDNDPNINPNQKERCDSNNVDENCNELINDDDSNIDVDSQTIYYQDVDEDGFGRLFDYVFSCEKPDGYVDNNLDCQDEITLDAGSHIIIGAEVNPNAQEICDDNFVDEDCDGLVNNNDPDISSLTIDDTVLIETTGAEVFASDRDNDNYGLVNSDNPLIISCIELPDSTPYDENAQMDCNDLEPVVHPEAAEVCDGLDNDCDNLIDDDDEATDTLLSSGSIFYLDVDDDGFGDFSNSSRRCSAGESYVSQNVDGFDCNDNNASINPSASEICDENNIDEDCDGLSDDSDPSAISKTTFYVDADLDGFGNQNRPQEYCDLRMGVSTNANDCNDQSFQINPEVDEICDSIDNDCDNFIDDLDDDVLDVSRNVYYLDSDRDGYGIIPTSENTVGVEYACSLIPGYSTFSGDCDDDNPTISVGAQEICDGIDNNCDDSIPNEEKDLDDDGFVSCTFIPINNEESSIKGGDDCNDNPSFGYNIYPNAEEICDGVYNDCNNPNWNNNNPPIDEQDSDEDGYIACSLDVTINEWNLRNNFIQGSNDCDDSNIEVLSEDLDGDCDGYLDTLDCAPSNPTLPEIDGDCDGILTENDCDDSNIYAGTLPVDYDTNCDGKPEQMLSLGLHHTCILDSFGQLYCFGDNSVGQTNVPSNQNFLQVASGDQHTCAITTEQNILCWGLNDNLQAQPPVGSYTYITSGSDFSCALDEDNYATCWGNVSSGRGNVPSVPLQSMMAGSNHICGIDNSNNLHCWGNNEHGQTSNPVGEFVNVDSGNGFSCAISNNKQLQCWGSFLVFVSEFLDDISAGPEHLCVMNILGQTTCYGNIDFSIDNTLIEIDSGADHACGIDENLNVWCWGSNQYLQSRTDFDADGTSFQNDCDDNNPQGQSLFFDDDCDGALRALDCNDLDPNVGSIEQDSDCDGTISMDENNIPVDCDDDDTSLGDINLDADCDGITTENDCDDNLPNDGDCDGVTTELDCDDNDPLLQEKILDNDCDGVIANDEQGNQLDCDDNDTNLGSYLLDNDCDGVTTENDCDDNDPYRKNINLDADCDGITTAEDCDDNDASDFDLAGDCDEDGFDIDIDCDDNNPDGTIIWMDIDCDGITTEEDCDDTSPILGSIDNDSDCDGFAFGDDCDDTNILLGSAISDEDCDGILDDIDLDKDGDGLCDITESNIDNDADCDGAVAIDADGEVIDCNDNDVLLGNINNDADCDGIATAEDCDDNLPNDGDCDGVTTENDCDDSNPSLNSISADADCDGVVVDDDCDDSNSVFGSIDQDWDCDGYIQLDDCNDYFYDVANDCLLPTQVSFGVRATWNESNQTLYPTALHGYFGEEGNPSQEDVSIDIWLMDDAYATATTEQERQIHLCHITADYAYETGSFALTLADGSSLSNSWSTFDGNILYYEELLSERCQNMDSSIFPTGQPEMFQNLRVGIAFAPLSETLENTASSLFNEYWDIHQSYYLSQYLFVDMLDQNTDQMSFIGTDFSYSAIYQVDSNRALIMDIDDFSPIRIPAENSPHIGYVEGVLGNTIPIQNILHSN